MHDVNDGFCLISGIAYPEKALKKDLWNAIKESRRPPKYVIDKMAEKKVTYFNSKTVHLQHWQVMRW